MSYGTYRAFGAEPMLRRDQILERCVERAYIQHSKNRQLYDSGTLSFDSFEQFLIYAANTEVQRVMRPKKGEVSNAARQYLARVDGN